MPDRDPELQIFVEHSAYYRWLPAPADSVVEGDVTTDSTFPGYVMKRVAVNEPTVTTTKVHLPSLASINDDRVAAGLGRRSHKSNLIRHLEDGPWYKHFPEGTITGISASNPQWETWLQDHFLGGEEIPDREMRAPENGEIRIVENLIDETDIVPVDPGAVPVTEAPATEALTPEVTA